MRFVDEVAIDVVAGKGGDGCLSFRRERCVPRGGPDGGNGGHGGDVYLEGHAQFTTLLDYRYRRLHRAANGQPGEGALRSGRAGKDLVLKVPVPLRVIDVDSGEELGCVNADGQKLLVAKGGRSGAGNACFKSSVNRTPRFFTRGEAGEARKLVLSLELLADVGLVGLPNAGKSTFLSVISNARPKVADYPFTTKAPELGVVEKEHGRFVVADIPGLIEGAHLGHGMGFTFLKHIARTALLLHLVDVSFSKLAHIRRDEETVLNELVGYSPALGDVPRWLVFSKVDALSPQALGRLKKAYGGREKVFFLSSVSGSGRSELLSAVGDHVAEHRQRLLEDSAYASELAQRHAALRIDMQARTLERLASREDKASDEEGDVVRAP